MAWWVNRRKRHTNQVFFQADKKSPWYLIAFGTIGGSLSGVTFVSIPGAVGAGGVNQQFSYWQIVVGYAIGYLLTAKILLPIYYKYNLVSIYGYLQTRFGNLTYKTGASFFVLSRSIGTAFRLFVTSVVLHTFIFAAFGIPFWATGLTILVLIFIYTSQGGIQTIIWTDALQTVFMLASIVYAIYLLCGELQIPLTGIWATIEANNLGQIFFFDNGWTNPNSFYKQVLAGISVASVMTGLDQDMMQKNLTCRTLGDSQKNLVAFSGAVLVVNFVFLILGALLAIYATRNGIVTKPDQLSPTIALQYFPPLGSLMFIIGLTAAAYASVDSALTALTTSFCIDILGMKPTDDTTTEKPIEVANVLDSDMETTAAPAPTPFFSSTWVRRIVHVGFAAFVFIQILIFSTIEDKSIINSLLTVSGYTYGPLMGLFAFGIFTKWQIRDQFAPIVCMLSPVLTYIININSEAWLWGYKFSFELLPFNGLLTFVGLWLIRKR